MLANQFTSCFMNDELGNADVDMSSDISWNLRILDVIPHMFGSLNYLLRDIGHGKQKLIEVCIGLKNCSARS